RLQVLRAEAAARAAYVDNPRPWRKVVRRGEGRVLEPGEVRHPAVEDRTGLWMPSQVVEEGRSDDVVEGGRPGADAVPHVAARSREGGIPRHDDRAAHRAGGVRT